MQLSIKPVTVETDSGSVVCKEAVVSVAVSSSVAVRVVPTCNGVEYPELAQGIVGDESTSDVANFLESVSEAARVLLDGRGI